MRVEVQCKGLSAAVQDDLERRIAAWEERHLAPLLAGVASADERLRVIAGKGVEGSGYLVRAYLHLPKRRIEVAHAQGYDLAAVLGEALDRLHRQTKRAIEQLRGQYWRERKARRAEMETLRRQAAETAAEWAAVGINARLERLLPQVERVARSELAYLRASGELNDPSLTVADVVDEAVVQVKARRPVGDVDDERLRRDLLQAVYDVLDRRATAERFPVELSSLEETPPPDAEAQAEQMVEEEFYEFHQPDEVLRLEDVIPDETALDPALAVDTPRFGGLRLLEQLPARWRRALWLHELESLPIDTVAAVLRSDVATVETWLAQGNAFLRARLEQAGFTAVAERPLRPAPEPGRR
ncbi:MAG: hypothetical protein KatS3mg121_1347 [Gammaproteobacteria bacterium]|nr:MAG: hypothetical protein KatS3mg121_1347 [Gammaproteobacteria bacterium]